ncbi:hypothetical protein ACVW0B_000278 [Thermostichus sp. MS-CIW-23]
MDGSDRATLVAEHFQQRRPLRNGLPVAPQWHPL